MSSSKGNVLSISRILEVVPPEALRYLVIRERPQRTINFDPGLPLLQLVDEIDDVNSRNRDDRAVELSQAGGFRPVGIPFKHLVVVAQATDFDVDRTLQVLQDSGYPEATRTGVAGRLEYARRWLDSFAPEELRFQVLPTLPEAAGELDLDQRRFLRFLANGLEAGMDGAAVQVVIYDAVGAADGVKPPHLFQAIYLSLLGKARGPRAAGFIAVLGAEFCADRFREAAGEEE